MKEKACKTCDAGCPLCTKKGIMFIAGLFIVLAFIPERFAIIGLLLTVIYFGWKR